jgi:MoaA/NifB/PqqE/SkfB family radical SAM enzyme
MSADVTVLWALRSPCNLGCRYCYFGTLEEHRASPPGAPGQLSHLSRADVSLADIAAFAASLPGSAVQRIFIAGGEPLIWPPVLSVLEAIKAAGVEVVVCTNGIPLARPRVIDGLMRLGIDAVSVSLDSATPQHHDAWRPAHNGTGSWHQAVSGIRALIAARGAATSPAVGIYTVVTARNISAITSVAALARELGCDYFVPQPLSLPNGHMLDAQLSLTLTHAPQLAAQFTDLYAAVGLRLPAADYPDQVLRSVTQAEPGFVAGCFGGRHLFFIEPDGSVWPCPSSYKIASLAGSAIGSICGATAAGLFGGGGPCGDCALFTRDCVNMWPLTQFTPMIIGTGAQP